MAKKVLEKSTFVNSKKDTVEEMDEVREKLGPIFRMISAEKILGAILQDSVAARQRLQRALEDTDLTRDGAELRYFWVIFCELGRQQTNF